MEEDEEEERRVVVVVVVLQWTEEVRANHLRNPETRHPSRRADLDRKKGPWQRKDEVAVRGKRPRGGKSNVDEPVGRIPRNWLTDGVWKGLTKKKLHFS